MSKNVNNDVSKDSPIENDWVLYLKWKNNYLKRVFNIRQSFVNGGKCERSCPFPDAHECVSKCVGMFPRRSRHYILPAQVN